MSASPTRRQYQHTSTPFRGLLPRRGLLSPLKRVRVLGTRHCPASLSARPQYVLAVLSMMGLAKAVVDHRTWRGESRKRHRKNNKVTRLTSACVSGRGLLVDGRRSTFQKSALRVCRLLHTWSGPLVRTTQPPCEHPDPNHPTLNHFSPLRVR